MGSPRSWGRIPALDAVAERVGDTPAAVKEAYLRLRVRRLLWLEADSVAVRMAPPFSGVPTQHQVMVDGIEYYANCAWDALGIPAALHRPGLVRSRV
jgi:Alkylmercury lyase